MFCQETQNTYMQPMKPTKKKLSYLPLAKPAKSQSEEGQVRPMCDDKKYQSTNFNKNPMCDDKNCQSTKCVNMWPVKPVMDMQSTEPSNTI